MGVAEIQKMSPLTTGRCKRDPIVEPPSHYSMTNMLTVHSTTSKHEKAFWEEYSVDQHTPFRQT